MAFFGFYETKKEKEERMKKEIEELQEKQMNEGKKMHAEMWQAARENKVYNQLQSGEISDKIGPAEINQIPQNGDNYTLFFDLPNREIGGPRLYRILAVNINLQKDKIHIFNCPYGPEKNFSFKEQKQEAVKEITEYIKKYTIFPK